MTVDGISASRERRASGRSDMWLDGLFTGMIGALAVAIWFFIVDVASGRPLYTPALLGAWLLHGMEAGTMPVRIAPLEIAAYTAFHFVSFVAVGVVFSWLMTLFEKFPIVFFVLAILFASLTVGFFALDALLGAQLTGKLQPWTIVVANVLAAAGMGFYQLKRHPRVMRKVDRLWQDEDDRR